MKQNEMNDVLDTWNNLAVISLDIAGMHDKFKAHDTVESMNKEQLREFLKFRFDMIQEEVTEGKDAIESKDPEEIVDAIIDMIVFGVGTLDLFKVDFDEAWNRVLKANMAKEVGVKAERPNRFQFPDLVKGPDWMPPSHAGNHGMLENLFDEN